MLLRSSNTSIEVIHINSAEKPDNPKATENMNQTQSLPGHFHFPLSLVLFSGLFALLAYLTALIPGTSVNNWQWYNDTYQSNIIGLGKYLYFVLLLILGYAYVNHSNLRGQRQHLFAHHDHKSHELIRLIVMSPLLFFMGANFTLKCMDQYLIYDCANYQTTWSEDYLNDSKACLTSNGVQYPPAMWEIWLWNYVIWAIPFTLGLHYTHLDHGSLKMFTLEVDSMKKWSIWLWLLLLVLAGTIIAFFVYLLYVYVKMSRIGYYIGLPAGIVFTLFVLKMLFRKRIEIHIHHSNIFMMLFVLIGLQRWLPAAVQGLFAGIFVEGICRWGNEWPFLIVPPLDHVMKKTILDDDGNIISVEMTPYEMPKPTKVYPMRK